MNATINSTEPKPLFISRKGQQMGPYSLDEAQNLFRSGTLVETDWAWHAGLTDWIPLKQVPGFISFSAPPVPPVPTPTLITHPTVQRTPAPNQSWWKKGLTGIVAIGVLGLKFFGPLLILLKTGGSMLVSVFAYSFFLHWTWPMAATIVFLIFVHEMGHVIAAKCVGIPVTAPLFIPFIGASITMKQSPRDAWSEAIMAYGGPLAGCIGTWICWASALYTQEPWLMRAAMISFIINLFNMIPIPPLDGGRICAAVSSWFWIIGLALLFASIFYFHAWNSLVIVGLVLLTAIPRIKQTLFGPLSEAMQNYYRVHIADRATMALLYVGLIAALLLGYWTTYSYLVYG